MRAEDLLND